MSRGVPLSHVVAGAMGHQLAALDGEGIYAPVYILRAMRVAVKPEFPCPASDLIARAMRTPESARAPPHHDTAMLSYREAQQFANAGAGSNRAGANQMQMYASLVRRATLANSVSGGLDASATTVALPRLGRTYVERILLFCDAAIPLRSGAVRIPACASGDMCVGMHKNNYWIGYPNGLPRPLPALVTPAEYASIANGGSIALIENNRCILCNLYEMTRMALNERITRTPARHTYQTFTVERVTNEDDAWDPDALIGPGTHATGLVSPIPIIASSSLRPREDMLGFRFTDAFVHRCKQAARAAAVAVQSPPDTPAGVRSAVAALPPPAPFFEWGPSALPVGGTSYEACAGTDRAGYRAHCIYPPRNGAVAATCIRWCMPSPTDTREYTRQATLMAGVYAALRLRVAKGSVAEAELHAAYERQIAPFVLLAEFFVKVSPSDGIYKDAATLAARVAAALATAAPRFLAMVVVGALTGALLDMPVNSIRHAQLMDACMRNPGHLASTPGIMIFAFRAYLIYMAHDLDPLVDVLDQRSVLRRLGAELAALVGRMSEKMSGVEDIERTYGAELRTCGVGTFLRTYDHDCPRTLLDALLDLRPRYRATFRRQPQEVLRALQGAAGQTSDSDDSFEPLRAAGLADRSVDAVTNAARLYYENGTRSAIQDALSRIATDDTPLVAYYLDVLATQRNTFVVPLPGFMREQRRALIVRYSLPPQTICDRNLHALASAFYCTACGSFLMTHATPAVDVGRSRKRATEIAPEEAALLGKWRTQTRPPPPQCLANGTREVYISADCDPRAPLEDRYICALCFGGSRSGVARRRKKSRPPPAGSILRGCVHETSLLGQMLVIDGRAWILCPGCASFTPYSTEHYAAGGSQWHPFTCCNCESTRAFFDLQKMRCIGRNCSRAPGGTVSGRAIADYAGTRAWICCNCDRRWVDSMLVTHQYTIEMLRDMLTARGTGEYLTRKWIAERHSDRVKRAVLHRPKPTVTKPRRPRRKL